MTDSLFASVLSWVTTSINAAVSWFSIFFVGKFLALFLCMFVIYLVGRSLFIPIIGGRAIPRAGSDRARPVSGKQRIGVSNLIETDGVQVFY